MIDYEKRLLNSLVEYMVSINDNNGALYAMAKIVIKSEGSSYIEAKIRRWDSNYLYNEAKRMLSRSNTELNELTERLVPTVKPTPDDLAQAERFKVALMQDYAQSQSNRWSTD